MTKVKQYFQDISKILKSQSELSSNISHHGLIGQNREVFIQNFIKNSFPQKFVIGTGEIIDSSNNVSKQADIVIYDEFMPSFDYGASKHFLSGGVLAHIEVKSTLNSEKLNEALDTTKSIKSLNRDIDAAMNIGNLPQKISSFLFAYDGMGKENFKQKILKYYNGVSDIDDCVDAVCVLNKYVMIKIDPKTNGNKIVFLETKEDSLMIFSSRLFDAMHKSWAGIPNLYKYFGNLNFKLF